MNGEKLVKAGLIFIGLGLICFGCWQYDPRIAYILGGIGLILMKIGWI